MLVTATEFRTNVGKYLDLMVKEDVFIMKYGKFAGVLSADKQSKKRVLEAYAGSYKHEGDLEDLLKKRLDEL
ncbi:hypothetical protein Mpt1_c04240 [Candidatus Methanoplasma termitum]|uniref:Phd_YefM n=1 Tax=Candidatus Methanoplasma termitum TaxID=1577791 RepID=A0A0A7LBC8_9ARCH|nr:hypothetical protein [Candidatus Methanoplasma termitum]AIZ56318.1 hypothetical protein Mpt1_c04240 [Candidatus Methanoplasma termitum]MCL2334313.1 hypothetical protein [Candidatus Methanoplasma sp.]